MKLKITLHGVAYEVDVEVLDPGEGFPTHHVSHAANHANHAKPQAGGAPASKPSAGPAPTPAPGQGSVASPIAGTVVEIKTKPGDLVKEGDVLLVIEAMKMKTSIAAPTSGTVKAVPVAVGDTVRENQTLVEFDG